jgi:hypothetical protein
VKSFKNEMEHLPRYMRSTKRQSDKHLLCKFDPQSYGVQYDGPSPQRSFGPNGVSFKVISKVPTQYQHRTGANIGGWTS